MIIYDKNDKKLAITIPIENIAELHNYQKSLLGVLAEIKIKECSEILKDDIKTVYKLLNHLLLDTDFLNQHEFLVDQCKTAIINDVDGKTKSR